MWNDPEKLERLGKAFGSMPGGMPNFLGGMGAAGGAGAAPGAAGAVRALPVVPSLACAFVRTLLWRVLCFGACSALARALLLRVLCFCSCAVRDPSLLFPLLLLLLRALWLWLLPLRRARQAQC